MGIEKIVKVAVGTAIGAGIVAGAYFGIIKPIRAGAEFNRVYNQALFQYADTNHDNIISAAEQDMFDNDLVSGKGVTLRHDQMPKYKDGSKVPTETITEWIRDYKPSE